jgi:catechol 2,3-dioxygenase-like lactoylglutathione lyase family enzyme
MKQVNYVRFKMTDHSTPNLPSRDFETTSRFFQQLGFEEGWRDPEWMILRRGDTVLEFFPHPELDPGKSWFSCCLRLDNLSDFYQSCKDAGLPETSCGWPRLHAPVAETSGLTIGALVDPDGTLIRLIQN